jgi:hypothetical protein
MVVIIIIIIINNNKRSSFCLSVGTLSIKREMKKTEILLSYSMQKYQVFFWKNLSTVVPVKYCKLGCKGENIVSLRSSPLKGQ